MTKVIIGGNRIGKTAAMERDVAAFIKKNPTATIVRCRSDGDARTGDDHLQITDQHLLNHAKLNPKAPSGTVQHGGQDRPADQAPPRMPGQPSDPAANGDQDQRNADSLEQKTEHTSSYLSRDPSKPLGS